MVDRKRVREHDITPSHVFKISRSKGTTFSILGQDDRAGIFTKLPDKAGRVILLIPGTSNIKFFIQQYVTLTVDVIISFAYFKS